MAFQVQFNGKYFDDYQTELHFFIYHQYILG